MKYTRMSNKIGSVVLGIIYALLILFMLGIGIAFICFDLYPSSPISSPKFSILWIGLLPCLGFIINALLGKFFGDQYYNTGYVSDGRSIYDVVKTPKYYTRRMFYCFVECFLFILLIIRYLFLFRLSITIPIIGIVCSIIAIIIYFIVGMSSYEQSSIIKNKPEKKKETKEETKKQLQKFKFDKYPELLEKYNTYKLLNAKKYKTFTNTEDKKQTLNEIDKSFESLAMSVFKIFNEKKPELKIKKTGEKIKWEEVFNKPFEELSYMEKLILVRLLDRLYKYVLPDKYYNL